MAEIFCIYAASSKDHYGYLKLPASDYEMLDFTERLRLKPGQPPYAEILKYREEYGYLEKYMYERPDIYQLNALARQLDGLDMQGMATFEGLIGMEVQKGAASIPISQLIDFAYSSDCCHVVEDAANDYELGRFLVENDFIEEAEGLPDSMLALLDFGKIGREHREAEGGVFTSLGYVEQHSEVRRVSETMDFQPHKPAYTILLNMARIPLEGPLRQEDMLQLQLPASEEQIKEALEKLGAKDWNDVAASIWDCPVPRLNREMHMGGEIPQIVELAQCLQELDVEGKVTAYKALLDHSDCQDISQALSLAGAVDEYIFQPQISSLEDVAMGELNVMVGRECAEDFARYVDLKAFGRAMLEQYHAAITSYGLIERQDGQPIQTMEQKPAQEGMVLS